MKYASILSYLASVLTIATAKNLHQSLSQYKTNGNSKWGTLDCPRFPDFLTSNPLPHGFPWGKFNGHDYETSKRVPHTRVTRHYNFTVARKCLSPDGYNKSSIFILTSIVVNGQFPGPATEANWGDWIEIRVNNHIYDGVPGISQCPIAPGSSFTYRFRADVYGTSWWHSQFSAQYTAGVFGPIIIYGPKHTPYDVDVGPLLLDDYYHREYFDVLEDAAAPTEDFNTYVPWSDNSLINGKNNYNCSMANDTVVACIPDAGITQFRFTPGKTHRLRLVNVGAAALLHFSIDKHKMKVIAHDFEPVVPYETDFITLGAAQRTDVLVKADQDPKETYWIRSTISRNCSVTHNPQALAVLFYEGNSNIQEPQSTINPAAAAADEKSFLCKNDDLNKTFPFFPKPTTDPTTTETIKVDLLTNATGHHWNVYNFGTNKTIRIVLNTIYQSAHPMHLHGHSFQVLVEGPGAWDGHTIINPYNPTRRDTHMQRRYGHLVIQFEADNPGTWSYHCHIALHASMGYNIAILERGEELKGNRGAGRRIPGIMQKACLDWEKWTRNNTVNQIDAGI
ncbi:Cupredoxin [Pyrenochaeta sp. MPI-SDFR-AT-0127]|nr:Cupredoxin [Pyrenochaeta sp. MPI-SDFR-AT-0127]